MTLAPNNADMSGPPPKPGAIRRRDGNPAKRPIPAEPRIGQAVGVASQFPPPRGIGRKAAAVWRQIVPDLVEIGLVRSVDTTVLEALCRMVARARDADKLVEKEGFVVTGHRGKTVHPAVRVSRDSWAMAAKIAEQYGMTAVGRLRVGAAVLAQKNLADELRDTMRADADDALEATLSDVLSDDEGN